MTEEPILTSESGVVDNSIYIDAIKDLKQNTVNKEDYNRLAADNKRLLEAIVNGQTVNQEQVKPKADLESIRARLFKNENISNLEYVSTALELRQALLDQGQPDCFLPTGKKVLPTDQDVECANRVAKVLQECVDFADGDSMLFTNELQRRTVDVGLPKLKK